jgi:hypothetical protein
MAQNKARRFPVMLESIDYMSWERRIVHLLGKGHTKFIVKSTVWYLKLYQITTYGFNTLSLGVASHSNINMLLCSLMFARRAQCHTSKVKYEINGHIYTDEYYLANNIYPKCSIFVKAIPTPWTEKKSVHHVPVELVEGYQADISCACLALFLPVHPTRRNNPSWITACNSTLVHAIFISSSSLEIKVFSFD